MPLRLTLSDADCPDNICPKCGYNGLPWQDKCVKCGKDLNADNSKEAK